MPQRTLDLTKSLVGFDEKPITENEKEITIKDILFSYLLKSSQMGLSDEDQMTLHTLGFAMGKAEGSLTLSTKEYDALKRMTDNGKAKQANGTEEPLFTNLVRFQVKEIIDSLPLVEETPANPV